MNTVRECFIECLGQQRGLSYFESYEKVSEDLLCKLKGLLAGNGVNTTDISVFLQNINSSYEQKIISKIQQSSVRNLDVVRCALDDAWKESIQENKSRLMGRVIVSKLFSIG